MDIYYPAGICPKDYDILYEGELDDAEGYDDCSDCVFGYVVLGVCDSGYLVLDNCPECGGVKW